MNTGEKPSTPTRLVTCDNGLGHSSTLVTTSDGRSGVLTLCIRCAVAFGLAAGGAFAAFR